LGDFSEREYLLRLACQEFEEVEGSVDDLDHGWSWVGCLRNVVSGGSMVGSGEPTY
jgi:hypothetical protein